MLNLQLFFGKLLSLMAMPDVGFLTAVTGLLSDTHEVLLSLVIKHMTCCII